MTNPLLPWSHSKLEDFELCPKKAHWKHVLKNKEPQHESAEEGERVHKALEDRITKKTRLPLDLMQAEQFITPLEHLRDNHGYELLAEIKLGVDVNGNTTGFFAENVYGRGKADVLLINHERTVLWFGDWKTGKRREKDSQISRLGLLAFSLVPTLERVSGNNIWLADHKMGKFYDFPRERLTEMRLDVTKTLEAAQTAEDRNEWPAKPTPLCAYCPVFDCAFNKNPKNPKVKT